MTTIGDSPDLDRSESPRVAVTGTPGTGKSTATSHLEGTYEVTHLNDLIRADHSLWTDRDSDRDSLVADIEAIDDRLGNWRGILESHLAHYFDPEDVVVLRCDPGKLEQRLSDRGVPPEKARENAESEAIDGILTEAVERCGQEYVYEIDTTNRSPEAVAEEISAVIDGNRDPSAGTVDFTGYL